jgi:hypothetical protein
MSMLDEVGAYLEAQGIGTVKTSSNNPTTWPIYKGGVFPANIDEVVSIGDGPSDPPTDVMGSTVGEIVAENDALVVQARSMDYTVAEAKAQAAWDVLHKLGNTSLSGTRYLLIMARQLPFAIGRDDKQRWLLGFNCDVTKEKS